MVDPGVPTDVTSVQRVSADGVSSGDSWLGVELRQDESGVALPFVYPGGPASKAGLVAGDVLQRLGEAPIRSVSDVHEAMSLIDVGASLAVVVQRGQRERLFRVDVSRRPSQEELMRTLYVGLPAPSISSLETLTGTVVPSFEQLQGHVVVLEFWASWCVACRVLTPELNEWHREGTVLGQRVIGITMDPIEIAADAVRQFEIEYSVHLDVEGEVTRAYRATALPMLFLVDRRGLVRDVVVGYDSEKLASMRELAHRLSLRP